MKIGVFDSGIGGLSVLHHARKVLPEEEFLFYMDTDHVPYGDKSKETVAGYIKNIVQFMIEKDCKAVVLACNTATAVAVNDLRRIYQIPVIGMEPAVKPAVEECDNKRIMVIATPLTVKGKKLQNLINRVDEGHLVDLLPLPELVYFAERREFDSDACYEYLKKELGRYDLTKYSELVLGCTHYNYFKNVYRRIIPKEMHIIDGIRGTVNQLKRTLESANLLESTSGEVTYYQSGRKVTDAEVLADIERLHERLEQMEQIQ